MVMRVLVVANMVVCSILGTICLIFVAEPAGAVAGALFWALALALLAFVPYTNPRRRDGSRW
jgi:hypothetical protein